MVPDEIKLNYIKGIQSFIHGMKISYVLLNGSQCYIQ